LLAGAVILSQQDIGVKNLVVKIVKSALKTAYGALPNPIKRKESNLKPLITRVRQFSSNFPERLGVILDQILGSAAQVGERRLIHVDAQVLVERGEQLAEGDRP